MIEVEAAGLSETGPNRSMNEDSIGSFAPLDPTIRQRKGFLYALADGVGGHQAGEVASSTAVETVVKEYYSPSNHSRVEPALQHAMQTANLRVHDLAQRHLEFRSMATTLTTLVLAGVQAFIAHIGDSRVYHWRRGRLARLTSDHSEAAELVRMRIVSPERLRDHPGRNVLTRTLGGRLIVRPDFLRQIVEPADQFVLCSDGLWSEVGEDEMTEILGAYDPTTACKKLIDLAVARDCADNVSVYVVKVLSVVAEPNADQQRSGLLSSVMRRIGRV